MRDEGYRAHICRFQQNCEDDTLYVCVCVIPNFTVLRVYVSCTSEYISSHDAYQRLRTPSRDIYILYTVATHRERTQEE